MEEDKEVKDVAEAEEAEQKEEVNRMREAIFSVDKELRRGGGRRCMGRV